MSIIGDRYNNLTIIEDLGVINKCRKVIAKCDCGQSKEFYLSHLRRNHTKSCGCLRENNGQELETHGLSRHPLNSIWASMRARCNNPKSDKYPDYGGVGVRVCPEWDEFKAFFDWCVANGWKKGLQIDKDTIPRRLGVPALLYSPEMCCIISCRDNQNAKKNNKLIEYNGKVQTISQWTSELGFPRHILYRRLKKGWSIEKSFTTPVLKQYSKKSP